MRSSRSLPSPAMAIAAAALVLATAGTALAGPEAITKALTKNKVKTIAIKTANRVVDQRASDLSVGHARTAANATNADQLNGFGSAQFLRRDICQSGGVQGYALFDGLAMNLVYDTAGVTSARNCSGGTVEALASAQGTYEIRFNGLSSPIAVCTAVRPSGNPDPAVIGLSAIGPGNWKVTAYNAAADMTPHTSFACIVV